MKQDFGIGRHRQVLGKLGRTRWLWLSIGCSTWLLGALLALLFVPHGSKWTQLAHAATPERVAELSTIVFSQESYTVDEGVGMGEILLVVDPPSSTPLTVTVFSNSIQAEADEDFLGVRDLLVIEPDQSTYTLSVTILDDQVVEGDEQLRLTFGNYQGVLPGVITETVVTIIDNDVAELNIGDVTVNEEAQSIALLITQSVVSTLDSVVDVRTIDGSASAPADYISHFTTAIIPAGSTQATVTVQLIGDEEVEDVENFFVRLEEPTNSQIANMTATVTLIDDDLFPELTLGAAVADEMDGELVFVAMLSAASAQTVTVEYATRDGSALAPGDYLSRAGVLSIPPGNTSGTVTITLVDDQVDEPEETLLLEFTNPVQAILSRNEIEGIIRDGFKNVLYLPGLARH